ncbi:MAG: cytochrome c3 family protein [Candidatus Aminicenantales bacterium]
MRIRNISRNQIFLFLGVVVIFILVAIVYLSAMGGIEQPLAFNHNVHAENGLECSDCHQHYEETSSSGRPGLEICASCHEEPLGESEAEKKLVEYIQSGKEIEWKRLYRIAEDVFFSHRRHVRLGGLECNICHGEIGKSKRPPLKPEKITMKKCMRCHKKMKVSNDCISCHR